MWKRLLILAVTLLSVSSIVCGYYAFQMNAAGGYQAGGSLSGRVNQAPAGLSTSALSKGDKFNLFIQDSSNQSITWMLVYHSVNKTWMSVSVDSIGSTNIMNSSADPLIKFYKNSKIKPIVDILNNKLASYALESRILVPRTINLSWGKDEYQKQDPNEVQFFIPTFSELAALGVSPSDSSFTFSGWLATLYSTAKQQWYAFGPIGTSDSLYNSNEVHPFVYWDLSDVVFSVSRGSSSAIGEITTGQNDPMKLRFENSAMSAQLNAIENKNNSQISKVLKDGTVYLNASANAGNDGKGGIYTLSALVFDDSGQFVYYQPLGAANGTSRYAFDLSGIPTGRYQITVVNEAYDENSITPADSSLMSSPLSLEIVEPINISVSGNANLTTSVNVNQGDPVAMISCNGGVAPISYTLISDTSVPGHSADYQKFHLSGNQIVVDEANGLHAGDYYLQVSAVDANGDPVGGVASGTVHIVVNATTLSVAFNNAGVTKKSIAQATAGWSEIASSTPGQGTKVTYSKSGGSIGLINIDPDTGAISYSGGTGFGKVEIKATADDDPSSGYNDFLPADTTKEIVIYREVDGSVTPDAASSDRNTPTFKTNDTNITPGGTIGSIVGSMGTPDQVTSGGTTYHYGLKQEGDHAYFSVNPNSGVISAVVDLSSTVGVYQITVTVSDQWSTKEIPVAIKVEMANSEDLRFYENKTSNTVINTKTVNFTDTNTSVFATVKGSTNTNPVIYSLQAGESTNVIDVNPNSGELTIKGTGTVVIEATKQGASGQADARAVLTLTVIAGTQNFIYTTDSTLTTERPKNGDKYEVLKETYQSNQTFYVYTTGNPTGSSVTYQLKAGSPTDVISVDPDGLVHILNASMNTQIGKVVIEATSHDPSGNFADKTIELPVTIEKGTRTVTFQDDPLYVINGSGSVVPNILTNGILDTEGNTVIEVDPNANTVAWTSDGITIQYNWSDAQGKDVKIHVTKPADRNYKLAEGDGTLHILGADESALTLSTPGKITYGDHFTIRSTQDDSMSTNVQYTFETDNGVYISTPQVTGNRAEFDALAYSGNTEITIKVTRTADGELPLTKSVKIKVLPKPITIEIEDKEKLRLEENPPLTYKDFKSQLVSWNGVQDVINESVIKLSTTAGKYSPIGSYPITAGNAQKQLNDNYPNYTFTIKDGKLNIKDNGDKNFWDTDDDGCPDLNIEIEDDNGNTILINGDKNEDGIPDYNIDINGDGKPELNIDTDNDGKADLNLVILKEWKPSQCITLGNIQFSSGITAKPEINIDLDNDGIPDINIDTDGDFKADLNISKDGKTASVNIATIESWNPDQDYKHQGLAYDTIHHKPYLNIDTDGDGRPDINLDIDGDGVADLNVDVDGDLIPDIDIDSTGDGKADINIDSDGDGVADENLMDITEWKPDHDVDTPMEYDTMKIEDKQQLEDNGIVVEKPDGSTFPSNMELKVTDVTVNQKADVINGMGESLLSQQEVKQVFEIKLLENGKEIQPDGTLKIKIPITEEMVNAILVKQNKDGTYEKLNTSIENGYLVYESDELGIVAIIADKENPNKEVQGSYYPGNSVGGALTGDTSNPLLYVGMGCGSLSILCFLLSKHKKDIKN